MMKWGSESRSEWEDNSTPLSSAVLFQVLGFVRRRLQWGSSKDLQLFRRLLGL